nr:M48 family peptidase [Acinetobacter sp.]
MFNKKSLLGLGLVVGLSGCTTVAELTGNDTATLSLNAEQDYQLIVNDAKAQKALDTTSST